MMHTTFASGFAICPPSACDTPAPSIPNLNVERSESGLLMSVKKLAQTVALPPSKTYTASFPNTF